MVIIVACAVSAHAQYFNASLSADAIVDVTDRWLAFGDVDVSRQEGNVDAVAASVRVGGAYRVFDNIYVSGSGAFAAANYLGLPNADRKLTLSEGVIIHTRSRITHMFVFDQRRYTFNPSGYSVSATRFSYGARRSVQLGTAGWSAMAAARCVLNIKSETADSPIVQRCVLQGGVSRRISDRLTLRLIYGYMLGGKDQPMFCEMHNMHSLSLRASIFATRKHLGGIR